MQYDDFAAAYQKQRPVADRWLLHPTPRRLSVGYSEGVRDCLFLARDISLLDLLVAKMPETFKSKLRNPCGSSHANVTVLADGALATVRCRVPGRKRVAWNHGLDDCLIPRGSWEFVVTWDGSTLRVALPTEIQPVL